MRLRLAAALASLAMLALPASASAQVVQERIDLDVIERIREEGFDRSQIMELGGYMTDVIGPRLSGSPAMKRANDWTADQLRAWSLTNVKVEPWGEFGRGWERVRYSGRIVEPFVQPLNAQPVAWTGSTSGTVTANVVAVAANDVADLARYRGRLKGAIVLAQAPGDFPPEFEPVPRRIPLETLLGEQPLAGASEQNAAAREAAMAEFRRRAEVNNALNAMLAEEGAAVILRPSARAYGVVRGGGSRDGRVPGSAEPTPELIVSGEQYGQLWRNVQRGIPVRAEIAVENRFFDDDYNDYNTLGDITGSDLADQYVMLGAHLDSWHYGTGATDNASGSVVMMEAVRILKALDLKPRRTIRIALWGGEEQGLLGSRGWVENNEQLWPKVSAYLNVDNGTGAIRGIFAQSNPDVVAIFEQLLAPFRDAGVVTVNPGNTGGTDHLSFDRNGIPGFQFVQDPIEYSIRTHHTDADTFERLVEDDLKHNAVVVAALIYHLAMRDEMLPRKPVAAGDN